MLEADYLVVGAGAAGMAFTDALTDHADVSVALVDRRPGPGGHWRDAYPFVRLHQSSVFYGVASTVLGGGRLQTEGPEAGLGERATAPEVCAYYERVLHERLVPSGKVIFLPGHDHLGGGRLVDLASGDRYDVLVRRAVVDARYLSPTIPALVPPPFGVADGVRVVPVNDLPRLGGAPSQYVVVGSGKTATDAVVWLLDQGVDPDAVVWVRPRDPWMLNRAVVQPDPAVFLGMAATTFEAAAAASSADDLFLRLEDAGVMLRIDPDVLPTMAKAPTLATWELDRLRRVERVVRLGHVRYAEPARLVLDRGEVPVARDAVVVHCAADGLRRPPLVPIWGDRTITLQPVRAGFPSFGAALTGYAEATVAGTEEKNRLCPPSPFGDTPASWAAMQHLGTRSSLSFGSDPGLKAWADTVLLNPARIPPERAGAPDVAAAVQRFRDSLEAGLPAMAALSHDVRTRT